MATESLLLRSFMLLIIGVAGAATLGGVILYVFFRGAHSVAVSTASARVICTMCEHRFGRTNELAKVRTVSEGA